MAIIPNDQQIRTLSGDVDLTNRGNALTQSQNTVYTVQDFIDTVGGGSTDLPYETIIIELKQSDGSIISQSEKLNTTGTTGGTAYTVTTFQQTGNPLGSGVYSQIRDASNNSPSYEDVSITQNSVRSSNAGILGVTSYYSGNAGYVYVYWQDWDDQSAQNPSAGTSNATYIEIRIYK